MLIDLHVHSSNTQGVSFSLEELASHAKQVGLDGFCITDEHTTGSIREIKEVSSSAGILILVGLEALTDKGHFLVFLPEPEALEKLTGQLPLTEDGNLPYKWLQETAARHQGILVAAHPFDRNVPGSPGDSLVGLAGVSAVEVLNASRPPMTNELAEEIAAGAGLPGVGGSDGRSTMEQLGRFATLVRGPLSNEAELIERIRSHDVWPVAIGKPAFPASKPAPRGRSDRRDGPRRGRSDSRGSSDRRRSGSRGSRGGPRGNKDGGRSHRRGRGKPKPPRSD